VAAKDDRSAQQREADKAAKRIKAKRDVKKAKRERDNPDQRGQGKHKKR
jgi:hypothetical protein